MLFYLFHKFVFQLFKSEIKIFNNGYAKEKVSAKIIMDENILINDYRVLFRHTRNKRSLNEDTSGKFDVKLMSFL